MNQPPPNRRVLLVDDNQALHADFRKILVVDPSVNALDSLETDLFGAPPTSSHRVSFSVASAFQGAEALQMVQDSVARGERFAMAFVDVRMPPGMDGIETTQRLWQIDPDLQIVICTAYSDYSWEEMTAKLGQTDRLVLLKKPFDNLEVLQLAHALTEKWNLLQSSRLQMSMLEKMVLERTLELQETNRRLQGEIDQRRRTQDDLIRAKDAAEAASRAKSEFLANMSHEIRTPMNGVVGMTDLLMESDLGTVQREYVTSVRKSGEVLLNIINDILDFSKIEAGKLELDPIEFELREVLGDALRMLGIKADEKGLELTCLVGAEVPDRIIGDSLRMRQVVINLVNNALKFTERGDVLVEVHAPTPPKPGDRQLELHFSVKDSGIGIPAEKLDLIFSAFTQVDGSTTRRYGGTGLGLTICQRLTHLMGGRIWVESALGQGSTFHFTVQLQLPDAASQPAPKASLDDLAGMPVLVIDDNETNRRVLCEMLRHWRMPATLAESGPAGLRALQDATRRGEFFGLILLDSNMPDMDGFAVASAIRRDPSLAHSTIMMLTSADRPGDINRSRELGLAAFLIKPISQPELLREVRRVIGRQQVDGRLAAKPVEMPPQPARPLRVLVVDDVAVNRRIAQAKIERMGHAVSLAEDGRRAIQVYSEREFDMVFMDVQMPDMDGFEATTAIRVLQQKAHRTVPVIAMTAMAMKGDREKCLAAGMDDYIAKPIEPGALERVIARFAPALPQQPTLEVMTDTPTPTSARRGRFDISIALGKCLGDEAILRELVEVYVADAASYLEQIQTAWDSGNAVAVSKAAHKIKGAISYFCGSELAAEARWLEENAATTGLDACRARYAALITDIAELNNALADFARKKAA
jgi:two-component system, sensor histidine kinase and response regulator